MNVKDQIKDYITSQPEPKQAELRELHKRMLNTFPKAKLWYTDGRDATGKVVSNPNIGYGSFSLKYANGTSRESFRIGISGNTTGISVYILGLADKKYLANTYSKDLGKASITGYCIKFKTINDIDLDVLFSAIRYGLENDEN
jgi:hypothetical protein